ncbi:hypothetical protein [Cryobacterium sp. MLB-32]|uniref:hypothetical protein n=1 Tax=Cryobacterium sp. MLB-32 TaxID=1529318 RepID=UPI0018CF16D7|nr:hypothetical protein [Cryobacterium sp. MLB-32]
MTSQLNNSDVTDLGSRLTVIDEQPLEERAAAFLQVHDELQARLEDSDQPTGADA